ATDAALDASLRQHRLQNRRERTRAARGAEQRRREAADWRRPVSAGVGRHHGRGSARACRESRDERPRRRRCARRPEDLYGGGAGGGRGRAGGPPAGPQLTPAYAEKRRANLAKGAEDAQTANCLPPGMPGIMGQPYPVEFLMTPGLVTIVIEAYSQVRHIYTDGRPLPEDPEER